MEKNLITFLQNADYKSHLIMLHRQLFAERKGLVTDYNNELKLLFEANKYFYKQVHLFSSSTTM